LKSRIILDLCGGSGSWSKPYKDACYDVQVITLPEYNVMDIQFNEHGQDVELLDNSGNLKVIHAEDIYGIFAAPTCTMFSLARTTAKTPRDFNGGMELVRKCLEVIWFVRGCQYSRLKFWALENPRGYLRQFLGKPALEFKHWEFGDEGIKPTDIWGYFKYPQKNTYLKPEGLAKVFPNGSSNAKNWSGTAAKRAITPPGFAQAFFRANR